MKNTDLPLWQQMFAPSQSNDELTELRAELSHNTACYNALQAFLHAEWLKLNAKARLELNPTLRAEYQQSANTLAELAGIIYAPRKPKTTESKLML